MININGVALATEHRLPARGADQRFTRIRALSTRVLGSE